MPVITTTIPNGGNVSGVVDTGSKGQRLAIQMPAGWTAANITLLASDDPAGTFQDVYDSGGTEVVLIAAASRMIVTTTAHKDAIAPLRYLKFRSGTTGTPVNQGAARDLKIHIEE